MARYVIHTFVSGYFIRSSNSTQFSIAFLRISLRGPMSSIALTISFIQEGHLLFVGCVSASEGPKVARLER